ncbi:LysE family transporter [Clostridium sp. DL1XJH146]
MIVKGFRFGMLLQLAIGPVAIFIFQIASLKGFYSAESGVLGVVLIDGAFITAAIMGVATIIERKNTKIVLKIAGAIILFIFGLSTVLSQFNINLLPSFSLQAVSRTNNVFLSAIILTVSNPLTIIFWAGVFSSKVVSENIERRDIYYYGFGALLSTIFFLTIVAAIGSFVSSFLPMKVIQTSNLFVGILLIYFSVRMVFKE